MWADGMQKIFSPVGDNDRQPYDLILQLSSWERSILLIGLVTVALRYANVFESAMYWLLVI